MSIVFLPGVVFAAEEARERLRAAGIEQFHLSRLLQLFVALEQPASNRFSLPADKKAEIKADITTLVRAMPAQQILLDTRNTSDDIRKLAYSLRPRKLSATTAKKKRNIQVADIMVPQEWREIVSLFPRRPYCCDEFVGNSPRSLEVALGKRYIQFNPPGFHSFIVVDIDRPGAANAWLDAGLPPPTWIAINPKNGHAHLVWMLSAPVWAGGDNQKPARLFKAIEYAYRVKLGGDEEFVKLLTKNPLHSDWLVEMPADGLVAYALKHLCEFVDLPKSIPKKRAAEALGRNCLIFDELRFWAYSAVRRYQDPVSFGVAVLDHVEQLNAALLDPLPSNEIRHIAKSVAKWTWGRYGKKHKAGVEFSARQAERGKASGKARLSQIKQRAVSKFRERP